MDIACSGHAQTPGQGRSGGTAGEHVVDDGHRLALPAAATEERGLYVFLDFSDEVIYQFVLFQRSICFVCETSSVDF